MITSQIQNKDLVNIFMEFLLVISLLGNDNE
jgi:hypothetical protein